MFLLQVPATCANVMLDLFVASKCPDAHRCETIFLPEVLEKVGSIVDLRLGFVGESNASADFGAACLHGDAECEGNIAQLCVQRHFPVDLNSAPLGRHAWTPFLDCAGSSYTQIPKNTEACLELLKLPEASVDSIRACIRGQEGRDLLREAVSRTVTMCGHHTYDYHVGCKSCTMALQGRKVCIEDGRQWYNCSMGHSAGQWVKAICDAYEGADKPAACDGGWVFL